MGVQVGEGNTQIIYAYGGRPGLTGLSRRRWPLSPAWLIPRTGG